MNEIPNILIVDDHAEIRDLVKRFLEKHNMVSFTAGDGKQMREMLHKENIDLVILDIMLPQEDGLTICKKLRAEGNNIPIIMLTAMTEETDRIVGLEIGADDYVTKPFNPRELIARIKAVLRRAEPIVNNQTNENKNYHFANLILDTQRRELLNNDQQSISLSTAEYELLLTFLQNPQRTLSRDFLLDVARGRESQVYDRSIDTLISRLRKKLKESVNNDEYSEVIKTVWGGGYCLICEVS